MRIVKAGTASLVAVLVAACGGGGGSSTAVLDSTQTAGTPAPAPAPAGTPAPAPGPAPAPATPDPAAGSWSGLTSTNRGLSGIVLNDGTYYLFYGAAGSTTALGGFLQGTGSSSGASFTSSNLKDFNLEGPALLDATLNATYTSRSRFDGTVAYANASGTFATNFDTDYDLVPSTATLAGAYSGVSAATNTSVTLTVAATGAITGLSSGGCAFTGSATPRAVGNAYDIVLTFGASPCDLVGATLRGVGLYDAPLRQLLAVGLNDARNQGFIFLGNKPAPASNSIDTKSVAAPARGFTRIAGGEPLVTFGAR